MSKEIETKVETTEEETQVEETKVEDTSVEEIKAKAEELEKQIKEIKQSKDTEEIKNNQLRRLEKAQEKLEALKQEKVTKSDSLDVDDIVTLRLLNIPKDSEKAKILAKYREAGLINSYESGLDNVAVKAEFAALDADYDAKSIIDENADEETRLKTTNEIIKQYESSGEIPQDQKLQDAIVKNNLKKMGF